MTDREKLIELLMQGDLAAAKQGVFNCCMCKREAEIMADFLLENGVIVPPVKVGQSIWTAEHFIDNIPRDGYVTVIEYDCNSTCYFYTSFGEIPLSAKFSGEEISKTVFLTREEAEKALKEREDNG